MLGPELVNTHVPHICKTISNKVFQHVLTFIIKYFDSTVFSTTVNS